MKNKRILSVLTIVMVVFLLNISLAFSAKIGATEELVEELRWLQAEMNVTVTSASLKAEKLSEAPVNITVISAEEMRLRGYRTLSDVFQDLPGTTVSRREPSRGTRAQIRGQVNMNFLKIMINGMTVVNNAGSNPRIGVERFPIHMIERVEFILGPYGCLYGRNSFSGVLNIITKKGANIDGILANVSYGEYDSHQLETVIGKKFGKTDILCSLYTSRSTKGRDLTQEYPHIYGLDARLKHVVENGETPFDPVAPRDFYLPWESNDFYLSVNHDAGTFFELTYDEVLFPKVGVDLNPLRYYQNKDTRGNAETLNTRIGYNYTSDRLNVYSFIAYRDYYYDGMNGYMQNTSKYYRIKNDSIEVNNKLRYQISDQNELLMGISYEEVTSYIEIVGPNRFNALLPEWDDDDIYDLNFMDITLQDDIHINENIKLVLGIMYEQSNSYAAVTLPRVSTIWNISDKSLIKFLYGSGFVAIAETYAADQITSTVSTKGSMSLKPEMIILYELNFIHKFTTNTLFSCSLFLNQIDDVIQVVEDLTLPAPFTLTYKNLGERKAYGLELHLEKRLENDIRFFLDYQYVEGHIETLEDGVAVQVNKLALTSPHVFKAGIHIPVWDKKANLYLHNYYINHIETLFDNQTLDGYHLVDIVLTTSKNFNQNWFFTFQIRNLFDEDGFDPQSSLASYRANAPIPKRRAYFSATRKF